MVGGGEKRTPDAKPKRPSIDPATKARRALAFIGLVSVLFGLFGVVFSVFEATHSAIIAPVIVPEATMTLEEAQEAFVRATEEALYRDPFRKPLAAANVLVSVLLLISGVFLLRRRPTAVWWVTQAALANVLWALLEGGSHSMQLYTSLSDLAPILEGLSAAQQAEPSGVSVHPAQLIATRGFGIVLGVATQVILYGWIAFRVRRSDVRALLASA